MCQQYQHSAELLYIDDFTREDIRTHCQGIDYESSPALLFTKEVLNDGDVEQTHNRQQLEGENANVRPAAVILDSLPIYLNPKIFITPGSE